MCVHIWISILILHLYCIEYKCSMSITLVLYNNLYINAGSYIPIIMYVCNMIMPNIKYNIQANTRDTTK